MISRVLCRVDRLLGQAAATRPVLGLDTSTSIANLALIADGKIAASVARPVISHGAALPGAVDELMSAARLKLDAIGAIAVGTGPGSFTGLRIGLSYAKGIAMASRCALVGVPSFDAMALAALERNNTNPGRLVCMAMDARKGEVYTALYRVVADGLEKLSEELVIAPVYLASRIAEDVTLIGDQGAKQVATLVESQGRRTALLDTGKLDLCGVCVAVIGGARFAHGETDRAASLEPLYIRTPEATFKPAKTTPAGIRTEGVWSVERKNSFGSI